MSLISSNSRLYQGRYYRARGCVLGDRFASEMRLTIRRILETPERWRVLEEDAGGHYFSFSMACSMTSTGGSTPV